MAFRYRVETTAAATIREVWIVHSVRGALTPEQVAAVLGQHRDTHQSTGLHVSCVEAQTTVDEQPREVVAVRYLGGTAPAVTKA